MVNPIKTAAKKDAEAKGSSGNPDSSEASDEEYELLPHKDIVELREELRKMKSMPSEAGSHASASFEELVKKMDRLTQIFEEAEKSVKLEEGAASFKEKMAPIIEKMNTILQQNSEIAEGIVALADIMGEIKEKLEVGVIYKSKEGERVEPMPSFQKQKPAPAQPSNNFGFGEQLPPMAESMPGQMPMFEPKPEAPIPGLEGFGQPRQQFQGGMNPPPMPMGMPQMPDFGGMGVPSPGPMPAPPAPMNAKKGMFGR